MCSVATLSESDGSPFARLGMIANTSYIKPMHWATWSGLLATALICYPWSVSSSWVSNSDVHALFEFWAAFVALTAGLIIMIHYFASGTWLFLIISLGFVLQSGEDLVHAIFSFTRIWGEEQENIIKFVPGTYAAGRFILISCIIFAWFLKEKLTDEAQRIRIAFFIVVSGIAVSTFSTIFIIKSNLPNFIIQGHIITRPADFITTLIYLSVAALYIKEFKNEKYHTPFVFSIICSMIFGMVAQIYMVHSQELYDSLFDMAHIVKIFSYVCPILGISFGTFSMYKKESEHVKALDLSVQKEKQLTAVANVAAEAEQQKAVELAVAIQQLQESQQALRVAYQQVSANEQCLISVNQQLEAKENALREAQRELMESVDEGFIIIDRDFRILSANHAYLRLCEKTDLNVIGDYCYEVTRQFDKPCHECGDECPAKDVFITGEPHKALLKQHTPGGKTVFLETKAYPMKDEKGNVAAVIGLLVDVTEKIKLEEQLHQSQKMEAVGTLAGCVAHDFNNMLTAIIGYSDLLRIKIESDKDDSQLELLDQVLAASNRATSLTRGLLAFSRKQTITPQPDDLNDIVRNVEKLLDRLIGEDVEFTTCLTAKELIAMADRGQIEQVLMNLATNARDAMPRGGTLVLATQEVNLREDFVASHGLEKCGRYALITVSDTGEGIDEQTREKIFDPFFTTKGVGQGTGLGLSIVYGIVKQHNGHINCYSEPGCGTTFKMYIPLIPFDAVEAFPEKNTQIRGGTETILIAEDDYHVRNMIVTSLTKFGYCVIDAADGQEALDKFRTHEMEIDLVVLDAIMPKKNGKELYDIVKATRPELEVLFISGYTTEIIHKKGLFEEGLEFLLKPVSSVELHGKIREMLDRKAKGTQEERER